MSTTVNVMGHLDPIRLCTARDGHISVIWIRTDRETVSLNLTDKQLDALFVEIVELRAKAVAA